jgi:hypothetical protein
MQTRKEKQKSKSKPSFFSHFLRSSSKTADGNANAKHTDKVARSSAAAVEDECAVLRRRLRPKAMLSLLEETDSGITDNVWLENGGECSVCVCVCVYVVCRCVGCSREWWFVCLLCTAVVSPLEPFPLTGSPLCSLSSRSPLVCYKIIMLYFFNVYISVCMCVCVCVSRSTSVLRTLLQWCVFRGYQKTFTWVT